MNIDVKILNMNKEVNRNSSFELLRIICMIMIVSSHYALHGGYPEVTVNSISIGTTYISILSMFGEVACGIFALMTGYFMIESDNGLKEQLKKSLLLLAELFFYYLIVFAFVYFTKITSISLRDIVNMFIPFYKENWYVKSYILFSLGIPYINIFLKSINKKAYEEMLVVIAVFWILLSTIFGNVIDIGCLGFMLFMYIIGAYTKINNLDKSNINRKYIHIYIYICLFCGILMVLSVIVINLLSVLFNSSFLLSHDKWLAPYNSIFAFVMSYCLFLFACKRNFYSKIINKISSTMLGIYILHDNGLMAKVIWKVWLPNINFVNNPFMHSLLKITVVLMAGIVIDLIRQSTIEKVIKKWLDSNFDILFERFEKIVKKCAESIKKFI